LYYSNASANSSCRHWGAWRSVSRRRRRRQFRKLETIETANMTDKRKTFRVPFVQIAAITNARLRNTGTRGNDAPSPPLAGGPQTLNATCLRDVAGRTYCSALIVAPKTMANCIGYIYIVNSSDVTVQKWHVSSACAQ